MPGDHPHECSMSPRKLFRSTHILCKWALFGRVFILLLDLQKIPWQSSTAQHHLVECLGAILHALAGRLWIDTKSIELVHCRDERDIHVPYQETSCVT